MTKSPCKINYRKLVVWFPVGRAATLTYPTKVSEGLEVCVGLHDEGYSLQRVRCAHSVLGKLRPLNWAFNILFLNFFGHFACTGSVIEQTL